MTDKVITLKITQNGNSERTAEVTFKNSATNVSEVITVTQSKVAFRVFSATTSPDGGTLSIDLLSEVDLSNLIWDIEGVTVSKKSGTTSTYDFFVPANMIIDIKGSSWTKITFSDSYNDKSTSSEGDPNAIPTAFTKNTSERKFIGTIASVLRVEITQVASDAIASSVEYLGRYGSPLTNAERLLPENIGHTRRRAIISTTDAPSRFWGKEGEDHTITNITDKWDGLSNTTSLVDLSYAVATYCASLGEGWYLPAQNQLAGAWVTYSGLTPFAPTYSRDYWSSTEQSGSSGSWYIDFSNGYMESNHRGYYRYVLCIRDL